MNITWLDRKGPSDPCPVCGDRATKTERLALPSPFEGQGQLVLLACHGCGATFFAGFRAPAYEAPTGIAASIKFYVEQGAGIDVMLEPLFALDRSGVRRYMEVGCGFGFSLDFAREALGWEVHGIDPSSIARAGREALDLPIDNTYLTAETDLGGRQFDLIFSSEVIEHIPEPRPFLAAIQRVLAEDGAFALTTPNAGRIRPDTPPGALVPLLSAGYHCVIYTADSLARLLAEAGFAHVSVVERGYSLHAVASRRPTGFVDAGGVDRALYRRYLAARADRSTGDDAVANGFVYRLYKELVNAADYEAAERAFERLRDSYRRQFDLDLGDPAQLAQSGREPLSLEAFSARYPFNLGSILYFRGMTLLLAGQDRAGAVQYLRAAARAAAATRGVLAAIGADDGESEELTWLGRIHACLGMIQLNPTAAAMEFARLGAPSLPGDPPDGLWRVPAERLADVRFDFFNRLVSAGALKQADQFLPDVVHALGIPVDGVAHGAPVPADPFRIDAAFCLGIMALNHKPDYPRAASLFRLAFEGCRAQPAMSSLLWEARYHEGLARRHGGDKAAAQQIAGELTGPPPAGLPPVPDSVRERALQLAA